MSEVRKRRADASWKKLYSLKYCSLKRSRRSDSEPMSSTTVVVPCRRNWPIHGSACARGLGTGGWPHMDVRACMARSMLTMNW